MFKAKLVQYKETLPLTDNNAVRSLHAKNDNFQFEHLGYYPLIDNGTFYYPAWKHYNRKTKVFCDRCHRQDLMASIGYAQFDLCLLCVDELTRFKQDLIPKLPLLLSSLLSDTPSEEVRNDNFIFCLYLIQRKVIIFDKETNELKIFKEEQHS